MSDGRTIWLTGLPSAGKSTIAEIVAEDLRAEGERVEVLDGDVIRTYLSKGLGFSKEDRDENIRRIGFVASLLARNGVKVLVAAISPYREVRDEVRALHGAGEFLEVHVATPVEVCSQRDVKGLYAKQRAGEMKGLTGVDDPYESPLSPELRLETQNETARESADRVLGIL
jgi:adenylylsulfate kinase